MPLIGRARRGYDCYDWRSPGEIEFLLVVMKRPEGERGRDDVSLKVKGRGRRDTHTHRQSHNQSQRPRRHHTVSNAETNKEDPDFKMLSGPGGEARFAGINRQ